MLYLLLFGLGVYCGMAAMAIFISNTEARDIEPMPTERDANRDYDLCRHGHIWDGESVNCPVCDSPSLHL